MFRSRNTMSRAQAARELERQLMTMEVVSGEEEAADADDGFEASACMLPPTASAEEVPLPDRLCFGPYGIAPLRGLHFDADQDTAAS